MALIGVILWFIFKWTMILLWRFFTGAHMSGRTFNDATWWHDASKRYRIRHDRYSWWKSKSRMKRVAWRHCIFWPVLILTAGFVWSWQSMTIILGCLLPGIMYMNKNRLMSIFFKPFVAQLSNGSKEQHWMLKTHYRRFFRKINPARGIRHKPGLATREELQGERSLTEIPVDYERAVRAELAEELSGQPPVELKLLLDPGVDF